MEIERKFLINELPDLSNYEYHTIEQCYLCTQPVIRIRKLDNKYILTYKSAGMMVRDEIELPLTEESYKHLKQKSDGNIITKKRYIIPIENDLKIELDVFSGILDGFILAEIEFPTEEIANNYKLPAWFKKDVTFDKRYHNSFLSNADEVLIKNLISESYDISR